jgi:hypothetical protein
MTIRRLRLRLRDAGRRVRDRAYARLAALCAGPPGPGNEAAAGRLFRQLVDWEATERTPLKTVLGRLPPVLAQAILREFGAILAAQEAGAERAPGGR